MSCWQTLGIDSSADKKTIKLAYAKRLKRTRPDDDPEGFIVLHQAYKTALVALERSRKLLPANKRPVQEDSTDTASDISKNYDTAAGEHAESISNGTDDKTSVISTISLSNHEEQSQLQHVNTMPVEVYDYQQSEYQKTLDDDREFVRTWANLLIESPLRANKIEEWKYIESLASMVDLNFSVQISDLLFEIVSKANFSTLRNGDPCIKPPVLNYLNDQYQWDKNWKKYEKTHGRKQSYAVFMFTAANKATGQKKEPNSFLRVLAFGIDITLIGICLYLGNEIQVVDFLTSVGTLYGLAGIPILEASALQASIGKWLLRLQVVDGRGQRMRWCRSCCRSYLTYISLAFSQITALVNLVTYFKYGEFVQDKLTGTYVIKRKP